MGRRRRPDRGWRGCRKPKVGTPSTLVDPDFKLNQIAAGIDPLENPSGLITNFGLLSNGTLTEPDENTYLVLDHNPGGPTPGFDYGRRFLFQGHENGAPNAYVTRINLDVPRGSPHRITLLTPVNPSTGQTGFGSIDGSTFNPFTRTMLFTQEAGPTGGVIQITLQWPAQVNTLDAFLGKAGYEGIHPDDKGNVYMIEDTGGATSSTTTPVNLNKGRQPNSFVYRYVPNNPKRLEDGGKLQALQVSIDGNPVIFGGTTAAARDADISAPAQLKLHTLGTSYPVKWVTIHTANAGDTAGFDANAAAKAAGATPFKRPENMAWLPGSDFRTFFFDPTGDTNSVAGDNPFLQARGAYGAIFRVDLRDGDDRDGDHDRDDRHGAAGDGKISSAFSRRSHAQLVRQSCFRERAPADGDRGSRRFAAHRTQYARQCMGIRRAQARSMPRFASSRWDATRPRSCMARTTSRPVSLCRTAAPTGTACSGLKTAWTAPAASSPSSMATTFSTSSFASRSIARRTGIDRMV